MCENNSGDSPKEYHTIHLVPKIKITKYILYKNVSGRNFSLRSQRETHVQNNKMHGKLLILKFALKGGICVST